jgi:hypothetical protein
MTITKCGLPGPPFRSPRPRIPRRPGGRTWRRGLRVARRGRGEGVGTCVRSRLSQEGLNKVVSIDFMNRKFVG